MLQSAGEATCRRGTLGGWTSWSGRRAQWWGRAWTHWGLWWRNGCWASSWPSWAMSTTPSTMSWKDRPAASVAGGSTRYVHGLRVKGGPLSQLPSNYNYVNLHCFALYILSYTVHNRIVLYCIVCLYCIV